MSTLSKEKTQQIFATHGGSANNTGSPEGQIALFTARIEDLSEHLKNNPKDHSSKRTLLHLVGKRKQLLNYLHHKNLDRYKKILEALGLRK
ncbi:MAG: 30S ribosomal protein S15 [Saprospiraceae bacterium]|nr:30S ribosomal protein S15 [Saprospiraceae bacterium]